MMRQRPTSRFLEMAVFRSMVGVVVVFNALIQFSSYKETILLQHLMHVCITTDFLLYNSWINNSKLSIYHMKGGETYENNDL